MGHRPVVDHLAPQDAAAPAAGLLDEERRRAVVPGLQPPLEVAVAAACRHVAQVDAGAARAAEVRNLRQQRPHRAARQLKQFAVIRRAAQTDDRPLKGRIGHMQPRFAAVRALAALRVVHFVPVGIVDRAEDGLFVLHRADGDGRAAAAAEVVRRAVDGIDDEGQAVAEGIVLRLLSEEGRAGVRPRQLLQQEVLHRHVRLGDEVRMAALLVDLRIRIVQHDFRRPAQNAVKSLVHLRPPDAG